MSTELDTNKRIAELRSRHPQTEVAIYRAALERIIEYHARPMEKGVRWVCPCFWCTVARVALEFGELSNG